MLKEVYDDFKRYQRDQQANRQQYRAIRKGKEITLTCEKIKPGDIIIVDAKTRIPADMILLSTSEETGTVFIRTDQLDGETDWKVRRAIPHI